MAARPQIEPRVLGAEQAAVYVGFRGPRGAFPGWAQRHGVQPIPGRRDQVFDRRDLDRALDLEKGIVAPLPDAEIDW